MRLALVSLALVALVNADVLQRKKHHHHKHHKHSKDAVVAEKDTKKADDKKDEAKDAPKDPKKDGSEEQILGKMKKLETELAKKEEAVKGVVTKGRIEVNGPLPADFAERFSQGVAKATGCDSSEVKVVETNPVTAGGQGDVVEVVFE